MAFDITQDLNMVTIQFLTENPQACVQLMHDKGTLTVYDPATGQAVAQLFTMAFWDYVFSLYSSGKANEVGEICYKYMPGMTGLEAAKQIYAIRNPGQQ